VNFWDASAITPLLIEEKHSRACRDLLRADEQVVAWQFTRTEVVAALTRCLRQDPPLSRNQFGAAMRRLTVIARYWLVIRAHDQEAEDRLHEHAAALMVKHPLQSGDALQLAAAMRYFEPVHKAGFVVIDRGLAHAARAEGFTVYPARPSRRLRRS
jgi:predicted nucleic acid-binding protein